MRTYLYVYTKTIQATENSYATKFNFEQNFNKLKTLPMT